MLSYYDTHIHLYKFADIDKTLQEFLDVGVNRFLIPSTDFESSVEAMKTADRYENARAAVGLHPKSITSKYKSPSLSKIISFKERRRYLTSELSKLEELDKDVRKIESLLLSDSNIAAVGEIGIDLSVGNKEDLTFQIIALKLQLELALKYRFPVVLHIRSGNEDAYETALSILTQYGQALSGVLHSFNGDKTIADRFLSISDNFYLGIGEIMLYDYSTKLEEAIRNVELSKLILETDIPFDMNTRIYGEIQPTSILRICEKISMLKNIPVEEVAMITTSNAEKLFK